MLLGAIFAATPLAPASAQMAIDRLWVDLDGGKVARSDLVIRNEGKDRYYVTVTPYEVLDPGGPGERRVEVADPEKLGLLVTPSRIVIDPGQLRAIRVVSLNNGLTKDRIYRINITPQIGDLTATAAGGADHGVAIKMLTAFDALVTVRPETSTEDLIASRRGGTLVLSNSGNSNILLLDGKVCPAAGTPLAAATVQYLDEQKKQAEAAAKAQGAPEDPQDANKAPEAKDKQAAAEASATFKPDECAHLPGRRLYAGNSWTVPEAVGETLTFNRRDSAADDLKPITIACGAGNGDGAKDSKFCTGAGLDAETVASKEVPSTNPKGENKNEEAAYRGGGDRGRHPRPRQHRWQS